MQSPDSAFTQIVTRQNVSDQIIVRQRCISLTAARSYLEQTGLVCLYASASSPEEVSAAIETLCKMPKLLRAIEVAG